MTWHYHCPKCGLDVAVDWEWHTDEVTCPHCHHNHYAPTPGEDHEAYFAGEKWSHELEETVIALRGTTCEVPGCFSEYSTLVSRRPPALGGRTSVANMVPMCATHARLKGDRDYDEWLNSLPPDQRHQKVPEIEITFTSASEAPPDPSRAAPRPPPGHGLTHVQPLAGRATLPEDPPAGYRLILSSPFLAGPARKLALHYDWVMKQQGSGSVILLAWPATEPPALARGIEGLDVPRAFAEHSGSRGANGTGRLDLELPAGSKGLWVAAVLLRDSGGEPALADFLLAATD
ncbi:hypothetical protein JXB37_01570 [candidate division WOR-3 bacterium]|nr:hypothetical protein [candidate division WOR-3 bacterium]